MFENLKGSEFFTLIRIILRIFNMFAANDDTTVALYGANSRNWIVVYITCILKGVRLVIIPPKMSLIEVNHIIMITNTNYIFCDGQLDKCIKRYLPLRTAINLEDLTVVWERNYPVENLYKDKIEKLKLDESTSLSNLKLLQNQEDDESSVIITPTSGVEHHEVKWVETNTDSISILLTEARMALPYETMDKIFSRTEFASSHTVTVLLPFVEECTFVTSSLDADIVIEDSATMEAYWKVALYLLYGNSVISWFNPNFFNKNILDWFVSQRLRKFYSKNLKTVIIYNCTLHEEIIQTLRKKLPIITTYGSQETNQLVAVNDYSTKELRQPNAVGIVLPGIRVHVISNMLEFSGCMLFDQYVRDTSTTEHVRFLDKYLSGDIGSYDPDKALLIVYGRKSAVFLNDFKFPVQLDKIERIIKTIPYFQDVLFVSDGNEGLILVVYPDPSFLETKKIGYLRLKELVKLYLNRINAELEDTIKITSISLSFEPLLKTHDGKIRRCYYD